MNNSRILFIAILIFLFFSVLVLKLIDIQLIKADELNYFAKRQQTNTETIKAERGCVYDRNNVLLAYNRNDISFYVDLRMLSSGQKERLGKKFSQTFGKNKNHYLKRLKNTGKTICIEKKAPYEKAKKLFKYKMNGMFYREEPTRIYQYKSLASHILGYVNNEYTGVNGIAKTFEDELNGENGARLIEKNAVGEIISVSDEQTKNQIPGNDVYLTINRDYQAILEDELKVAVSSYSAESAVGIIMNPSNGEILALANLNDYDPNNYWKYGDFERKNRAITDVYEPGSTFKVFTLSALFDKEECIETETLNVENGKYKFRNAYVNDTHKFNKLTVKEIFEESSNIGVAKLVQRISDDTYYDYIRAFGFGTYTSVTLPGEVTGKLHKPADWSKITKVFMSFGYNISVTPLQLTTAFCAVLNGGMLYQPLIVKKIVDKNNNLLKEYSPIAVRRVISEKTSERMKKLLAGAVENGTGNLALLNKVTVGGKTGTSKVIVNGKYSKDSYFSTFIGFLPAEKPKLVCYVMINKPKGEYYGGKVSAPVFKKIVERIVELEPEKFLEYVNSSEEKNLLEENTFSDEQTSVITAEIEKLTDKLDERENILVTDKNLMPNLSGRTVKEAIAILNQLGLNYDLIGSGVVTNQSIKPGANIIKNRRCKIYCSDETINGTRIY
ncbi:MAG: transpeptidase family protein [Ignavibacteria bacterium]|nr:transpeptidase family protein [Ignavibacteria bacterium]